MPPGRGGGGGICPGGRKRGGGGGMDPGSSVMGPLPIPCGGGGGMEPGGSVITLLSMSSAASTWTEAAHWARAASALARAAACAAASCSRCFARAASAMRSWRCFSSCSRRSRFISDWCSCWSSALRRDEKSVGPCFRSLSSISLMRFNASEGSFLMSSTSWTCRDQPRHIAP